MKEISNNLKEIIFILLGMFAIAFQDIFTKIFMKLASKYYNVLKKPT